LNSDRENEVTSTQTNAARAYRQQAVLTASKEKLVVLLYEGALRYMDRALHALEAEDIAGCGEAISKAFAVIGELRSSLDREKGGEIGENLDRLYGFVQDQMILANRERTAAPLTQAREVISTLKEGWDAVICS